MRPSVLHVLAPAPVGGLETVVYGLARGQHARGVETRIAAILGEREEVPHFLQALQDQAIAVHLLRVPPRAYGSERRQVLELLQRNRPGVVHTHGYRPDVLDSSLARRLGIPTVTTVHGFTGNGLKNRFYEWLQRRSFRRFDAVVAVSRELEESLRQAGVSQERLHLIPNAWVQDEPPASRAEARSRLNLPDGALVIGVVGRLSHEKGPDLLLHALARIRGAYERIYAVFVGTGPEQPQLEALAARLHLKESVRWLGRLEQAWRWMSAFDVLALPSRTEGTPMVLFEASAAGVPVVATSVGGVPDVLGTGPNVVPPADASALARGLAHLLSDADARCKAVSVARKRIEDRYGFDNWIESYLRLYDALASATDQRGVSS